MLSDKLRTITARWWSNGDNAKMRAELNSVVEDVKRIESRVAILDVWLKSRGLPLDWTGPLDAWGWALFNEDGIVCGYDHEICGHRPPGDPDLMERWDEIGPQDRSDALQAESDRRNKVDGTDALDNSSDS